MPTLGMTTQLIAQENIYKYDIELGQWVWEGWAPEPSQAPNQTAFIVLPAAGTIRDYKMIREPQPPPPTNTMWFEAMGWPTSPGPPGDPYPSSGIMAAYWQAIRLRVEKCDGGVEYHSLGMYPLMAVKISKTTWRLMLANPPIDVPTQPPFPPGLPGS